MKHPLRLLLGARARVRVNSTAGGKHEGGGIIPALVIVLTHLKCTSDVIAGGIQPCNPTFQSINPLQQNMREHQNNSVKHGHMPHTGSTV